jgi:hypothetical protein
MGALGPVKNHYSPRRAGEEVVGEPSVVGLPDVGPPRSCFSSTEGLQYSEPATPVDAVIHSFGRGHGVPGCLRLARGGGDPSQDGFAHRVGASGWRQQRGSRCASGASVDGRRWLRALLNEGHRIISNRSTGRATPRKGSRKMGMVL